MFWMYLQLPKMVPKRYGAFTVNFEHILYHNPF